MIFCLKCETEILRGDTYGSWDGNPYHWVCLVEALLERISVLQLKIERMKRKERDE